MKGTSVNNGKRLMLLGGFLMLWGVTGGAVWAQHYPAWWAERGVINTASPVTNDFAVATQGQVKWIVRRAMDELNDVLPNGAGSAVVNRVAAFSWTNNYRVVNQGQLKSVAAVIYDRLIAVGYTNDYPWTATTNDDRNYAAANQGMVKNLFSFDIRTWVTNYCAVLHVDAACTNPVAPYARWETAATSLESAVGMGVDGSVVRVADGHYAVDRPVRVLRGMTIRSTNGCDGVVVAPASGTGNCFEVHSSGVEFDGIMIRGGVANQGGGVYIAADCSATFNHCSFIDNRAYQGGGVFINEDAMVIFNSCLFEGNRAESGGAVYGFEGWDILTSLSFNNCRFFNNRAALQGGVIYGDNYTTNTFKNCTLLNNHGGVGADGVIGFASFSYECYLLIQNSILGSNSLPVSSLTGKSRRRIAHSAIQGGIPPGWRDNGGNRTNDPGVIMNSGRLKWNSSAIDAGMTNELVLDFERETRRIDATLTNHVSSWDMGADEFVDTDNDHMADRWEEQYPGMTSASTADDDSDGLTNQEEYENGSHPLTADTDGDGVSDGDEVHLYHTNPLKADSDGDGLSDDEEIHQKGTNPLKSDSDDDGLFDADEIRIFHTNPINPDTDGDGMNDAEEINRWHCNPLSPDRDGDGLYRCDPPNQGGVEMGGSDADADGISDAQEGAMGLSSADPRDGAVVLEKARQRIRGRWSQAFASPLIFHYAPGTAEDLAEMTTALEQLESAGILYVPGR